MAGDVAARVAVVGAGYAGLAAAVELADAGIGVDVFESSRTLGGRARAVDRDGVRLDNGVHILVGAYGETLRLMEKVGAGDTVLKRHRLRLEYPGHARIAAPPLPAPWHLAWALLAARGLSWRGKFAAIRFMRALQARGFRLPADITAAELFAAHRQPEDARRFLWEPLCLAALNTPVAIASAQVFLNVLRDSLAAGRAASDLLLPATDFSSLFPDPAARFITARGGRILRATRIATIEKVGAGETVSIAAGTKVGAGKTVNALEDNPAFVEANRHSRLSAAAGTKVGAGWTVTGEQTHGLYAHLILATAPYHLPHLLAPHPAFAGLVEQLAGLRWQPIVTAYLQYPETVRLPFPMAGLYGGHGQWLFDRGALCGQPGMLGVVISGTGPWQALGHAGLAAAIHGEIARLVPGLPLPLRHWVIEEKRATFACTPGLGRPETATACPDVWLAGDYVAGDYPATLEGAVRSGTQAARRVVAALSASRTACGSRRS